MYLMTMPNAVGMMEMIQALGFTAVRASREYAIGEPLMNWESLFPVPIVVVGKITETEYQQCADYARANDFELVPFDPEYPFHYRVSAD